MNQKAERLTVGINYSKWGAGVYIVIRSVVVVYGYVCLYESLSRF